MSNTIVQEFLAGVAPQFRTNVAVERGGTRVSYQEVERRANTLANFLISRGVGGPGRSAIVAVLVEDRLTIIPTLLGILKAGCAFVPLDPHAPASRLAALLDDLRPGVCTPCLIADAPARHRVSALLRDRTVVIETEECSRFTYSDEGESMETVAYGNDAPCYVPLDPDGICYIYYTSGSTGKPKGIAGRLKSLSHFVEWEIDAFHVDPSSRVSQLTTPAFDAYLRDIFVPLCSGGTVCLPPTRDRALDGDTLSDWLDASALTLLHCVPSVFRMISATHLHAERFASLRHILMAGEQLFPADVDRWMSIFGGRIQLVNLYGPSETTMVKFCYRVQPEDRGRAFIPIGQPIRGARALVLDEQQRVCAPGIPGEIYIRSPYLTLGYYNQPELTRQVFIPNPFGDDPGDIVYKTGDMGLLLDDGTFHFVGRRDNQVKIRGQRVELGDVEAALREHPRVRDGVVLALDDERRPGEKSLVAYVVPRQDDTTQEYTQAHTTQGHAAREQALTAGGLRDFLQARLPQYMVPTAYVSLDALPLTPNGKVDRRALLRTERAEGLYPRLGSVDHDSFVAPRTPLEEVVAGVWSQVLGVESVGVHDNFFQLGGHSLLATQIIARLRQLCAVDLPLRCLFAAPTVAALAALVAAQQQGESEAGSADTAITPGATREGEAEQLLAQLDLLSDEDVAAVLEAMLQERER